MYSVDIEIYQVEVERVYLNHGFTLCWQTSYMIIAIPAENHFVFDIMLYSILDVLDISAIGL